MSAIEYPQSNDPVAEGLKTYLEILVGLRFGRDIGLRRLCFAESEGLKVESFGMSVPAVSNGTDRIESLGRLSDSGTLMRDKVL